MSRHLLLIPIAISLSLSAYGNAATDLQKQLKNLKHYQAQFTQSTVANGHITSISKGKVWIQRPWQMRWQVDAPNKQTLLVNGHTLYNINPDLNQATVRQMNPTELSNAGLLLSSSSDLNKTFTIKSLPNKSHTIHTFMLTPKKPLQLTEIILNFAPSGLVSMKTENTLGQKNVFLFAHVNNQASIAKQIFQFKPAKGMDILKAGALNG